MEFIDQRLSRKTQAAGGHWLALSLPRRTKPSDSFARSRKRMAFGKRRIRRSLLAWRCFAKRVAEGNGPLLCAPFLRECWHHIFLEAKRSYFAQPILVRWHRRSQELASRPRTNWHRDLGTVDEVGSTMGLFGEFAESLGVATILAS